MTISAPPITPLPVCPPLVPGESFVSWMNRIAFRSRLPLGLLLPRLTVAATNLHSDMPAHYGLSLTAQQISQVAAITGADAGQVSRSLLSGYRDGPLDLRGLDEEATAYPLAAFTRNEWMHLTRSPYCPDCLREDGGAWKLAWRLPWSFACATHQVLLNAICPDCQQPTGQARGDRTARPNFIALVPEPERCGSAIAGADIGYVGRPGRAARPCDHNLAETLAVNLDNLAAGPVLASQEALDELLGLGGHRQTWADLRALVAVLMTFADTSTLADLAVDLSDTLFTLPALVDAMTSHDLGRQDRTAQQQRVRDGGVDHRTGVRQRYGTATPADPALMALLTPVALRLHGPLPGQQQEATQAARSDEGLDALARLARARHKQLPFMLETAGGSPDLLERAEHAARSTGRFTYATQSASHLHVEPTAIPAYLWEDQAAPFIACLPGTGDDTARKFTSLHLVKTLTGDTWEQAAARLGHPVGPIATLTCNLVNRMRKAGTQEAFRHAAQDVLSRLANGDLPTVDYARRRHDLSGLRSVPAEVLHSAGTTVATKSRRRCSAAWLWAHLTGGHPYEAPTWGSGDATSNQREVYRRYMREHLPALRDALVTYGHDRLALRAPAFDLSSPESAG